MAKLLPTERKIILLSSIGGALEFYDLLIFVYVAHAIGEVFFSHSSPMVVKIAPLFIFAISYFFRPLGGIVLSHFGDTIGRKSSFLTTIAMMAIPTFVIAILPGYSTLGILAPILLIICRIIQGFAVGGEIPGAIVYVTEHTQKSHRVFACAAIFAGLNLGMLLAQLVAGSLQSILTDTQYISWGWRIAFILGAF